MEPITEKRQAFGRAKELLEGDSESSLRYAALELRRCLEAIVYEKLLVYRSRLPEKLARTWQPPQAFKALAAIEPGAERTSKWMVAGQRERGGPPSTPFRPLGVDLRPDLGWLTKTYNKLGSFLHADFPFSTVAGPALDDDVRAYLLEVLNAVEPFIARSFTSALAPVVSFTCRFCGNEVLTNAQGAKDRGEVFCLKESCSARYLVEEVNGEFSFHPDAFQGRCPECEKSIPIPHPRVKIGHRFTCSGCSRTWEFVHCEWKVQVVQDKG